MDHQNFRRKGRSGSFFPSCQPRPIPPGLPACSHFQMDWRPSHSLPVQPLSARRVVPTTLPSGGPPAPRCTVNTAGTSQAHPPPATTSTATTATLAQHPAAAAVIWIVETKHQVQRNAPSVPAQRRFPPRTADLSAWGSGLPRCRHFQAL